MESLRELYRIGKGPSSSHSMAPFRAASMFGNEYSGADRFEAILFGSLAKTGKGHLTDKAVEEALAPRRVDIVFNDGSEKRPHPNTMDLMAYKEDQLIGKWRVASVGGGKFEIDGKPAVADPYVYRLTTFDEIKEHCLKNDIPIWQYVEEEEGEEIWVYLHQVWRQMKSTICKGLAAEGVLPGSLNLHRKAKYLFTHGETDESDNTRYNRLVCAYAYAVAEESAGGGIVVTAPTCGSSGVVAAVLYYCQRKDDFSDTKMV